MKIIKCIKQRKIFLSIIAILLLLSCNKNEDECVFVEDAKIMNIENPLVGIINKPIIIPVTAEIRNGCGSFFEFNSNTNLNQITVKTRIKYEGCECSSEVIQSTNLFEFTPTKSGIYNFIFINGNTLDNTVITVMVE